MEPFFSLILTLFLILARAFLMKKPRTAKKIIEVAFIYSMVVMVGLGGLVGFVMHAFFGPRTAAMIGWLPGSPFQYEVAVADLAFGVVGLLVPWIRGSYWLAAALGNAVFLIGCAAGHIKDLLKAGNTALYNAGPVLYISDIAVPLIVLGLAVASMKVSEKESGSE
jgi:hypothetical protein